MIETFATRSTYTARCAFFRSMYFLSLFNVFDNRHHWVKSTFSLQVNFFPVLIKRITFSLWSRNVLCGLITHILIKDKDPLHTTQQLFNPRTTYTSELPDLTTKSLITAVSYMLPKMYIQTKLYLNSPIFLIC